MGQGLARSRFGEGVITRPQTGHKDLSLSDFAAGWLCHRDA